uniref:Transcriptional regulator n=1 Tax=Anisakis simplex TaxID=6269 RepID=A0A0M3JHB6_ANISI
LVLSANAVASRRVAFAGRGVGMVGFEDVIDVFRGRELDSIRFDSIILIDRLIDQSIMQIL